MRNLKAAICVAALLAAATPAMASKYADIIVDARTGKVLHAEDPDGVRYPASLTKMMTVYLAFDEMKAGRFQPHRPLTVSHHAAGQPPTHMGLKAGEVISLDEAIYAAAIKSANDAAVVIAENIAGSEEAFAERMTRKARALGMRSTTFRNASGLPDLRQQTTARDMATLGLALLRDHPERYRYFASNGFYFRDRLVMGHNRLNQWYEGADGIKTGFIRASGFNLVTSAQRDGRRLVGVVLGGTTASDRDRRMAELLDYGFQQGDKPATMRLADLRLPKLIASAEAATPAAPAARAAQAPRSSARTEAPAPARAERAPQVAAASTGGWAVQVGAFQLQESAQRQLAMAQKAAPALGGAATAVAPVQIKGKQSFRARFVGLSEREARDACRTLDRKGQTCAVLPPSAAAS